MCGIIGYVGEKDSLPIILEGLTRLEYRGYDSAGVAYINADKSLVTIKTKGKINELKKKVTKKDQGIIGIGHTRWATHGEPNDINAHPHTSNGSIALVHNGIIENFQILKKNLLKQGYIFESETDTEVIAHLIHRNLNGQGNLFNAVKKSVKMLKGSYALAIIGQNNPKELIVTSMGSPLVVGKSNSEYYIASDIAAIISYTKDIYYLNDGEIMKLGGKEVLLEDANGKRRKPEFQHKDFSIDSLDKGQYPDFMLKEIYEQATTVKATLQGADIQKSDGIIRFHELAPIERRLQKVERIIISACGTSWHAGLIGEYLIEDFCNIPVEVEYASEFRYRSPIIDDRSIMIVISQSGETADTIAALREAKLKGATVLAICNVRGSTIDREADATIYLNAGIEIGVASTKAFTSQIMALTAFSLQLGRMRFMSVDRGRALLEDLIDLPGIVKKTLKKIEGTIRPIASKFSQVSNFLYLGRGYNFPVALEGALKLKEISYIHAEGYPAAEMKHGPIALIDENMPVIFIAIKDPIYEKVISNIEEVKARKGIVIAIATEGDKEIEKIADHVIFVPKVVDFLSPIINVIPLQLLAYHVAILRGCDVDQPRNLAKAVTVE